jgi:hypothetical protein
MTIDVSAIRQEFIRIAEEEVGDDLYSSTSVYIARDDFPTSNYPYIIFDVLSLEDTGSWLLYEGVDQETNETCYISHTRMLLQYTVKGDDSLQIANKLKNSFKVNRILREVTENTGGGIERVFSVNSLPSDLSTTFLESASFNITFNIEDVIRESEEDGGIITQVTLDGSLSRDETEDTNPLDIDVTATSPDHT